MWLKSEQGTFSSWVSMDWLSCKFSSSSCIHSQGRVFIQRHWGSSYLNCWYWRTSRLMAFYRTSWKALQMYQVCNGPWSLFSVVVQVFCQMSGVLSIFTAAKLNLSHGGRNKPDLLALVQQAFWEGFRFYEMHKFLKFLEILNGR